MNCIKKLWYSCKNGKNHVGVADVPKVQIAPELGPHFPIIPEGWFVLEMGQSPVHLLWFCHMVNTDDAFGGSGRSKNPRRVWTEEHDTPIEALQECFQRIAKETQNETVDGRA